MSLDWRPGSPAAERTRLGEATEQVRREAEAQRTASWSSTGQWGLPSGPRKSGNCLSTEEKPQVWPSSGTLHYHWGSACSDTVGWPYLIYQLEPPHQKKHDTDRVPNIIFICVNNYACMCVCIFYMGFPGGSEGKESTCNAGDLGFDPWVGKIPWRAWQPTPVFLPGESPWTVARQAPLSMGVAESQRVGHD